MTYRESPTGLMLPSSQPVSESSREYDLTVALLESRIGELEMRLQEQGWMKLDGGGREFSRETFDNLVELARVSYLKNPIINRAVEIGALYVWGQDISVTVEDEDVQAVVDRFWKDNHNVLTGQQASRLLEVELEVTGNVFLALFPDKASGSVHVRPMPMEEIRQIVSNPEDRAEVWYYLRGWQEQPVGGGSPVKRSAFYPDWRYRPATKPDSIEVNQQQVEIRWETPIVHVKAGAFPHWRWGVSEVYAALDWAKAYKELLEDDATRSRALAKFAWKLSTQGGKNAVAAAKTRIGTTIGGGVGETNPPPGTGSMFIGGQGVDLDPIKIAGATLNPDHSRPARLMASAALGISDHFFDADVGNHATASTLDRPTELRFSERRSMWVDLLGDIIQFVIDRDLEAPAGILRFTPIEEARAVVLAFPDLLEKSVTARVEAVVTAATLDGKEQAGTIAPDTVSRLLLSALNVDDIDGELEKLADQVTGTEEREAFVEALQSLLEALHDQ